MTSVMNNRKTNLQSHKHQMQKCAVGYITLLRT